MRKSAALVLPSLTFLCLTAWAQQLAFTSRVYIEAPVSVASVESSKEYGFESAVLRNDSGAAAVAVQLQITVRLGETDEVADRRRVVVNLSPHESRKFVLEMAQIRGIKDQVKSRKQDAALVVIAVEAVEFQDGTVWQRTETGIHLDSHPDRLGPK